MIRHASLVALRLGGRWAGALVEGPSAAGKSDLALRALETGFRLVSDDGTVVWASGGALFGRAPGPLDGLIEARGVGILTESPVWIAQIRLVVACAPEGREIERLPDPRAEIIDGIAVARLELRALEASAPAKMRRAIEHLGRGQQQAYQAGSPCGQDRAGTGDTF
jgi:serine kinase of HPr protein (carbohydrate metabolism regulator)